MAGWFQPKQNLVEYITLIHLIPSMVSDVAAMFVATTTLRTDRLGGSNTLFCSSKTKVIL